jgi:4-amino-4-deoxy-L-arabinose transferase-like glycosyltransferase
VPRAPVGWWLLFVAGTALAWNLGGYPLLDPDEGRTAEVAREMNASGNYIVPHLDGLPYLDKPVCYFAAAAATMLVLGPTATAARLPALLATFATAVLVIVFAQRRWGPSAGWVAGLSVATMPLTLGYAHTALMDSTLTLCTTAAILAFAADQPTLAWGAIGVGGLTKGPVALAVPLVTIVPYALVTRVSLRRFVSGAGLGLFALLTLPWFGVVTAEFPSFPSYAFGRETLLRFATATFRRTAPVWYYLPILAAGTFPWIVPACSGLGRWRSTWQRRLDPQAREPVLLAAWVLGPLVLFTLDQSKLPQYVLPLGPPLALAAAANIAARGPRAGARPTIVIAIGVALALLVLRHELGAWLPLTSAERGAAAGEALALSAALLGLAACLGLAARLGRVHLGALGYALPVFVLAFTSRHLMAAVGEDHSSAGLASAIRPALGMHGQLLAVGTFPPSLAFYLRRTMPVATADAHELTSNFIVQISPSLRSASSSLRAPDQWRRTLDRCPVPTVFVVHSGDPGVRARFAALPLIADDGRNAAFGPCQPVGHR